MLLNGHIYRGRKPVHWSPSSRTALAEAELEYPDNHKSKSVYVTFPVESLPEGMDGEVSAALQSAAFAVWTTTPWTMPANMAIAVNGDLQYSVVQVCSMRMPYLCLLYTAQQPRMNVFISGLHFAASSGCAWSVPCIMSLARAEAQSLCLQLPDGVCDWLIRRKLVVAHGLLDTLSAKLKLGDASALQILSTVPGSALEGCMYRHPLFDRTSPVIIGGDYITLDAGTGLVHTAPGHGQEDYMAAQQYGLPLLSPVDAEGNFTAEAEQFAGLNVLGDGNTAVIDALKSAGVLLKLEDYKHKYPYDWRTKKPTIFRATEQWFASVEGFKQGALDAIGDVMWMPAVGENRIRAMTESRCDTPLHRVGQLHVIYFLCSTCCCDLATWLPCDYWVWQWSSVPILDRVAGLTGASRGSVRGVCQSLSSITRTRWSP